MKLIPLILSFLLLAAQHASAVVMVGFGQSAPASSTVLAEQTVFDYNYGNVLSSVNHIAEQKFRVTENGTPNTVQFYVRDTGTAATVVAKIGTAQDLSSTFLCTGSVDLVSWTAGVKTITLTTTASLSTGTDYYLAIYASAGNDVYINGSASSSYAYPSYFTSTGWSGFSEINGVIDIYFRVGIDL